MDCLIDRKNETKSVFYRRLLPALKRVIDEANFYFYYESGERDDWMNLILPTSFDASKVSLDKIEGVFLSLKPVELDDYGFDKKRRKEMEEKYDGRFHDFSK